MEQLNYNLLYRWFVGLTIDDAIWVPTVFTKNRDRLLDGDVAEVFFNGVLGLVREKKLLSDEHFTVDGTLIEAWAGQKSFQKKGKRSKESHPDDPGNPTVDFHGGTRTNDRHESTTDPEARLYRKGLGKEAKLCYRVHVLMENRHGLVSDGCLTLATGTAEREAAKTLVQAIPNRRHCRMTVGADEDYNTRNFVHAMSRLKVTPHVAQNITNRSSAINGRTTRHGGYEISQRKRKLMEEIFGWVKTIGLMRKTRHRGRRRVGSMFRLAWALYNMVRINNLLAPG